MEMEIDPYDPVSSYFPGFLEPEPEPNREPEPLQYRPVGHRHPHYKALNFACESKDPGEERHAIATQPATRFGSRESFHTCKVAINKCKQS